MFFFFSKVLSVLFFPLPLTILIGFIVSFFIKGFRNKFLLILPILWLWFFSSFPVSQFLLRSLENKYPPVPYENVPKSDVVVVLGGMINPLSSHPEKPELLSSADRLTDSVILWRQKKVDRILFTGGSGILFQQDVQEAKHAKKILSLLGVPESQIFLESESRNTYENALYTSKILQENGWEKVILVTSAFHMERSKGVFEKQGIKVFAFPTDYHTIKNEINWDSVVPSSRNLENSTTALKEWIGLLAYKMKGYL